MCHKHSGDTYHLSFAQLKQWFPEWAAAENPGRCFQPPGTHVTRASSRHISQSQAKCLLYGLWPRAVLNEGSINSILSQWATFFCPPSPLHTSCLVAQIAPIFPICFDVLLWFFWFLEHSAGIFNIFMEMIYISHTNGKIQKIFFSWGKTRWKQQKTSYFVPRLNQENISSLLSKLSQAKHPP